MALTIDELNIRIVTEAKTATASIDSLTAAMKKLGKAVGESSGLATNLGKIANALQKFSTVGKLNLTSKINQLSKLNELIPTLGGPGATQMADNLGKIANALMAFSAVPKVDVSSLANGIKTLNEVTSTMNNDRLNQFTEQMKQISFALSQLGGVGKSNISSMVNAVKKIPEITNALSPEVIDAFAEKIKRLTEVMTPLATEMDKVARGFNSLPKSILRAISATERAGKSAKNAGNGYKSLFSQITRTIAGLWTVYYTVTRVANVFAEMYNISNEYVEALNLFKVSMGDAADSAQKFAEDVGDAMGIDPAEWMQNQGVFQRLATGFGIASDEANIMSQNLTQLAYDLSSFFNTDVETAMQKLQSGMSGQIKGLKAWGYNLSVAALQETALSLGIEESVRKMSEAQKAQLRYITLIQKSKGIMGDMAKTINTPANAMRILSAQITLLKRSLGNMVSVFVTEVIPVVQAFVELMSEAANALAKSWGFKIEELPTTNLEMAEEVIDGLNDEVDDASDAVATLKKQLAGFDELNILSTSDSDSKTDEILNSLNINLPEYDFLSNLDSSTQERIDEIKEKLRALGEVLKWLAPIATALFTALSINLLKEGFFATIGLFTGDLKTFGEAFKAARAEGTGFFKSINSSLTKFQKATITIASVIAIFTTFKDAIGGLVDGSKKWGEALVAIIPTLALFGTALYAALGPIGLVIGAVAALAGAIVGAEKAHAEMRKEMVKATFYDTYGTEVSVLADAFEELALATIETFDSILEHQETVLTAKENIESTTTSLDELVLGVENSAISIEEAVPRIADAFKKLYDESKTYLTGTRDLIISSLAGGIVDVETSLKEKVLAATGALTEEASSALDALNEQKTQLDLKLEAGTIDASAYTQGLAEIMEQMSKITGISNEHTSAIESAGENFNKAIQDALSGDLTWTDDYSSVFSSIAESADTAKEQITTAYEAIIDAYEEQQRLANELGQTEKANLFGQMIETFTTAKESDLAKVDSQLEQTINALQTDLFQKFGKVFESAKEDYDGKSGWYKFWHSESTHVGNALADYQEGEFTEIIASMKDKFGLSDDDLWVDDASDFLEKDVSRAFGIDMENFYDSMENAIRNATSGSSFDNVMESFNSNFTEMGAYATDGLTSGITEGQESVNAAVADIATSAIDTYKETMDINSPSRVMESLGQYTIQGLAKGLGNISPIREAMANVLKELDITSKLQALWGNMPSASVKAPSISAFTPSAGNVVSGISSKSSATSNNQLVQGIASAVYSAIMSAQEDSNGQEGGNARIIVQIGDQAVGEASVRYINGKIVQTGTSPIYC